MVNDREDFPLAKPDGELRILMVGDSFTYGDHVDNGKTLPAQLEARLKRRCAARVINAGIAGTTIVTHFEMSKRALPLSPDLVVLTFTENDIADIGKPPIWYSLERNRKLKSNPPLSLIYPVLRRTAIWNFGKKIYKVLASQRRATKMKKAGHEEEKKFIGQYREEYKKRLVEMRDELRERGIPLVFAVFPSHEAVTRNDLPENLAWVVGTARALDLPVVHFLEDLRDAGLPVETLYLLPDDGHASPEGYRVASSALVREIDWQGLGLEACGEK